ncbi:hypothetical protein [Prochlorococcus marinus]|nr:hypothetical protein [Prochlorococcus marinus]
MKKTKRNKTSSPDPYEGMVSLEKLDAYESLLKSNVLNKQDSKSIE